VSPEIQGRCFSRLRLAQASEAGAAKNARLLTRQLSLTKPPRTSVVTARGYRHDVLVRYRPVQEVPGASVYVNCPAAIELSLGRQWAMGNE